MKYLFVHQNFPGQYLHIVKHLAQQPDNEIVFISQPSDRLLSGVRSVFYQFKETPSQEIHYALKELNVALHRADEVKKTATVLKNLGFVPDIIIGHHGWGEMLNLQDVYPSVPLLGYFEFFYHNEGLDVHFDPEFPVAEDLSTRVRVKNSVNLLSLANPGWGQTPTLFQWSIYPEWARKKISILREGVDLNICAPNPEAFTKELKIQDFVINPNDKLVTYVARGLEPYRGFHILLRALPKLMAERPDVKVVMVGRDQVSYGASLENGTTWKEFLLRQLSGKLDFSRILFPGQIPYTTFVQLLQRSDAHIYMTYPFVLSWSLREAMAMGCAIIASDTQPVREFIADRITGILTPFLDPDKLADRILEVLEDQKLAFNLRQTVRLDAERSLSMEEYLKHYEQLIMDTISGYQSNEKFELSPAKIAELSKNDR